jgi:hypothetical protein
MQSMALFAAVVVSVADGAPEPFLVAFVAGVAARTALVQQLNTAM